MAHEHNRNDREKYIKVQYKQLADWEDVSDYRSH